MKAPEKLFAVERFRRRSEHVNDERPARGVAARPRGPSQALAKPPRAGRVTARTRPSSTATGTATESTIQRSTIAVPPMGPTAVLTSSAFSPESGGTSVPARRTRVRPRKASRYRLAPAGTLHHTRGEAAADTVLDPAPHRFAEKLCETPWTRSNNATERHDESDNDGRP